MVLAHQAGFTEVDDTDINNLLRSHHEELSNEDLMVIEQDPAAESEEEEQEPELKNFLTMKIPYEAFTHFDKRYSDFNIE